MTPQTLKVFEKMKNGDWYSQEQAFEDRTTFRMSNKIREMESLGFVIAREVVAPKRRDFKYRIVKFPDYYQKAERKQEALIP